MWDQGKEGSMEECVGEQREMQGARFPQRVL